MGSPVQVSRSRCSDFGDGSSDVSFCGAECICDDCCYYKLWPVLGGRHLFSWRLRLFICRIHDRKISWTSNRKQTSEQKSTTKNNRICKGLRNPRNCDHTDFIIFQRFAQYCCRSPENELQEVYSCNAWWDIAFNNSTLDLWQKWQNTQSADLDSCCLSCYSGDLYH